MWTKNVEDLRQWICCLRICLWVESLRRVVVWDQLSKKTSKLRFSNSICRVGELAFEFEKSRWKCRPIVRLRCKWRLCFVWLKKENEFEILNQIREFGSDCSRVRFGSGSTAPQLKWYSIKLSIKWNTRHTNNWIKLDFHLKKEWIERKSDCCEWVLREDWSVGRRKVKRKVRSRDVRFCRETKDELWLAVFKVFSFKFFLKTNN